MKSSNILNLQPVRLLQPRFDNGGTLLEALKRRRTHRSFRDTDIPLQFLSDILWAAQGVNRKEGPFGGPGRTSASASNSQEIRIYVAKKEAIYLYNPDIHVLTPIAPGDYRSLAIAPGQENTGANAPVRFLYVVDKDKFNTAEYQEPGLYDANVQKSYYFVDTGLIVQNVYLAACSLGLASWFHNCNRDEIDRKLGLKPRKLALFGQTIGYPGD